MRKEVVIGTLILLLLAVSSCEKNWTCSCTCTYTQIGGTYTTTSTIYNSDKAQAQNTCYNQLLNQDKCSCEVQ